jgi:rhodanese-related sulfurtransferase/TusA-related sulfurtransferase
MEDTAMTISVNQLLDAKGLACPMPLVKTKKAMEQLPEGQVLEIQATDKGSIADMKSWSAKIGHTYLGNKTAGEVIHHYIRKSGKSDVKPEQKHAVTMSNDELQALLADASAAGAWTLLDVREPAEYAFGHIPQALSIPLGELERRAAELDRSKPVYVVCRTGNRSDLASQQLVELGFDRVTNIIPGMSGWNGPLAVKE